MYKRKWRRALLERLAASWKSEASDQKRSFRQQKLEKELAERNQDGRRGLLLKSKAGECGDCAIGACDDEEVEIGRMRCCGACVCKHCILSHFATHDDSIAVGYTNGVNRVHEDPITLMNGWARQNPGRGIKVKYDAHFCPFCKTRAGSVRRCWTP